MGFVAIAYATCYARKRMARADTATEEAVGGYVWELWDQFPKFILGFLLLAAVASASILSDQTTRFIENAYGWLFLLAFVGLGTNLKLSELRSAGFRPIIVVAIAFIAISVTILLLLSTALG